jgi:F-type H+-transporting ATPase subunit epsilon
VAQVHVDLVAVEAAVWSGDADLVLARTLDGELGVLPGHAPVLGQLASPSEVIIRKPDGDLSYKVTGGFLSVTDEGVTILAETAESLG